MTLSIAQNTAVSDAPSARAGTPTPALVAVPAPSKAALWGGRVLSGLATAFLTFDLYFKFVQPPEAVKGTADLGYSPSVLTPLGVVQATCLALYLYPRTAVLGAILWTGYLGGAVATHVRVENPVFSHMLFPIYVALFLWGGLWLRKPSLRRLLPLFSGDR